MFEVELRCLAALDAVRLSDPRWYPHLATWLLSSGLDSEATALLAGLDLEPFAPEDARDGLHRLMKAHGLVATPTVVGAAATGLAILGRLFLAGRLPLERVLRGGAQVYVTVSYVDEPREAALLYGLLDEWEGGWGRPHVLLADEVRLSTHALLREQPDADAADLDLLDRAIRGPRPFDGAR